MPDSLSSTVPTMAQQRHRPIPVVWLSGPPASGKSTCAGPLARELQATLIDLDVATNPLLRRVMALMGVDDIDDPALSTQVREARYQVVHDLALDNVRVGRPVVCVAPFTKEARDPGQYESLRAKYSTHGAVPVLVWLTTPPDVIMARMRSRNAPRDRFKLDNPDWVASLSTGTPVVPHLEVPWPRDDAAPTVIAEEILNWSGH